MGTLKFSNDKPTRKLTHPAPQFGSSKGPSGRRVTPQGTPQQLQVDLSQAKPYEPLHFHFSSKYQADRKCDPLPTNNLRGSGRHSDRTHDYYAHKFSSYAHWNQPSIVAEWNEEVGHKRDGRM
jgi:hypothetical protein